MLDVKALFMKLLVRVLHIDACLIKAENISVPVGTADTTFNPTNSYVVGGGSTFSKGTNNKIVVKEACTCIVITTMLFSAVSATSATKVVGLAKNSNSTEIAMAAVGYPVAWSTLSALDVVTLAADDTLHFTGRCASGTNTLRQANIAIIRIA